MPAEEQAAIQGGEGKFIASQRPDFRLATALGRLSAKQRPGP